MTTKKFWTRILAQSLIVALLLCALPFGAAAAELPQSQATFTFTDQAIAGEGAVLANEISGTTLTIKQSGVYTLTGSCSEGGVVVAKGVTGVTLILRDLKLASAKGAPVSVEAKAEVTIYLLGTSALENKAVRPAKTEKPAEPAAPAEAAAASESEGAAATVNGKNGKWNKNAKWTKKSDQKAEKKAPKGDGTVYAAIKVKAAAKLTVTGEGALFLNSTVRNPISCAKNAKATLKGNALNFNKKYVQKAAKPAPVEVPAEAAEPAAEPAAEAAQPAAEAPQAAEAVEPAAAEEGAAATVTAKKAGQNRNMKGQKGQKNWKNTKKNKQGKPLEIKAGDALTVKNAEGSVILSAVAPIDAKQVIFVSEKLTAKQSYSLFVGETQAAKATARASASLIGATGKKVNKLQKNGKNAKNGMNWKRGSKKNAGKAQPAAAPAETANVA